MSLGCVGAKISSELAGNYYCGCERADMLWRCRVSLVLVIILFW